MWLGQWKCVLQERYPIQQYTLTAVIYCLRRASLLKSRGTEWISFETPSTLHIWGKFVTSASSAFTSRHRMRTTALCTRLVHLPRMSKHFCKHQSHPVANKITKACFWACWKVIASSLFHISETCAPWQNSRAYHTRGNTEKWRQRRLRTWCNHHTSPFCSWIKQQVDSTGAVSKGEPHLNDHQARDHWQEFGPHKWAKMGATHPAQPLVTASFLLH